MRVLLLQCTGVRGGRSGRVKEFCWNRAHKLSHKTETNISSRSASRHEKKLHAHLPSIWRATQAIYVNTSLVPSISSLCSLYQSLQVANINLWLGLRLKALPGYQRGPRCRRRRGRVHALADPLLPPHSFSPSFQVFVWLSGDLFTFCKNGHMASAR